MQSFLEGPPPRDLLDEPVGGFVPTTSLEARCIDRPHVEGMALASSLPDTEWRGAHKAQSPAPCISLWKQHHRFEERGTRDDGEGTLGLSVPVAVQREIRPESSISGDIAAAYIQLVLAPLTLLNT